ncbi:amino acid adenylation domain-containing protein [Nostoc sp. DSM 114159]|jgi:amino acid adenylation domain-containing protein/non-ribosomal peptide synthase protein (TIGR01720 family)
MTDLHKRLENLSIEKRELLLQKLKTQKKLTFSPGKIDQFSPIATISRDETIPLSFAQQRLWFLDELENGSANYNMAAAVRLIGCLQVAALEGAIAAIVQRHEVLRTNFQTVNGTAVQVIAPTLTVTLPVVDLQTLTVAEKSAEVKRLAKAEADKPFDLAHDSLLRITLLKLSQEEHILLVTIHHIISDGWSIEIFFREMTSLYEALVMGTPSLRDATRTPLAALPIQYADFAHWQRQWLQGELLEKGLNYWKQQLAGIPALLSLPSDRPRPNTQSFRGDVERFQINPDLTKKLKDLSRQSGATLFMTLLTAFAILLSRYSNQSDIVVGSPIANRNRKEIEPLIGFFVNTLLLRVDLQGEPSFSELLHRVRQIALDAYTHQDIPFEKLVEELHPERSLSYNPLFQVMFVLQNTPQPQLELAGLSLSLEMENVTANFDLSLSIEETEQELIGAWEYNTDLFDAATIKRMVGHFCTLLKGIVANPQQQISALPILTASERQQLLVEWNNTHKEYPQDKCIHQLIEAQVEKTPERTAAVFENKTLTYSEVNHKANQLASLLQAKGINRGQFVPVLMEKSLELLLSHLAIMKAGAAFVPMDPKWPIERIKEILHELNTKVVLVSQDKPHWEALAEWSCIVVDEQQLTEATPNLNVAIDLDDPIYAIFTSGSTGKPKGAINQHRGIVNRFFNMNDRYGSQEDDVILFTSNFIFDSCVWQLYWPLINGARTVIPAPSFGLDLPQIIAIVEKQKVTITDFVPSVFNILLDYLVENPQLRCHLKSLRQLVVGGEAMSAKAIYQFKSYFPSVSISNAYGPTETSIGVIFNEVSPTFTEPIPIGKPLHNVYALILDRHLNPVPIGVPGELYLGGQCVGLGYLNNETATRKVFIPNPFAEINSKLLYKTGDLVRYLPDGTIDFLGRIDNQVKIRGIRIELGEIEAILAQHPKVRRTVVIAREDRPTEKHLVAYVIPNHEQATTQELRRFLRERLPEYTIPSTFVVLDSFPLTPNGKIDWRALPVPDSSRTGLEANFVAPRTTTEATLAKIWADVLGQEQVGIHDNFFELGGDSILSIQVVARANQAGFSVTPKLLFQHQTIAELATVASTTLKVQAEQGVVTGQVPLTPIQQWFFAQNQPELHHYNQSVLVEVLPLNPELLKQTVQQLLMHHDALRLRFTAANGWQQVNAGVDETVPFTVADLSGLTDEKQRSLLEATANELQASLNLADGPIIRVALFQLGNDKPSRLLIVIHHLAVDGVSWRILLEDLATAYQQLSLGEPIQLPAKTTAFKDWASRLIEYGRSQTVASEWDYWLAQSSTIAPLPIDYPLTKTANTVAFAAQVSVSLSMEQTQALLHDVPAVYNTQINDVLLTALLQTFCQWTGEPSLLIDLEGHGREELFEDVDLSRTVGWFTTVFPIRLQLGETEHLGELLKSVKEQLRYLPNRGIGYGILRYLSQDTVKQSQLAALPQAEVCFNYLGQFDRAISKSPLLRIAQESSGENYTPWRNRNYQLEIDGLVELGKLQLNLTYSKNLYQQSTIEHLAQTFIKKLTDLITHCQSPQAGGFTPSDFPEAQLNQQELDDLVAQLNLD